MRRAAEIEQAELSQGTCMEHYFGYFGGFTVTRLILFVYDSGATPRGHRLVRIIAAWC